MKPIKVIFCLIGAGALTLAALPALALPSYTLGPGISDALVVWDGSGNINQLRTVSDINENGGLAIIDTNLRDASQYGNPTLVREPAGGIGTYSDIFGVAIDPLNGNLVLGFLDLYDDLTYAQTCFGPQSGWTITVTEGTIDQTEFDATMYLNPSLRSQGWTAAFVSDSEPAEVPDGGTTVVLLGAALSALGLIKRRLS